MVKTSIWAHLELKMHPIFERDNVLVSLVLFVSSPLCAQPLALVSIHEHDYHNFDFVYWIFCCVNPCLWKNKHNEEVKGLDNMRGEGNTLLYVRRLKFVE